MKNLFKGAKFGDRFLTRDGRKAIYQTGCDNIDTYNLIVENELNIIGYHSDGTVFSLYGSSEFDIVKKDIAASLDYDDIRIIAMDAVDMMVEENCYIATEYGDSNYGEKYLAYKSKRLLEDNENISGYEMTFDYQDFFIKSYNKYTKDEEETGQTDKEAGDECTKNFLRLEKRLKTLIETYKKESEEDSSIIPISESVSTRFSEFLKSYAVRFHDLFDGWNIFSNDKGALNLEYDKNSGILASICITENNITYSIEIKDKVDIKGSVGYYEESIILVLEKVKMLKK